MRQTLFQSEKRILLISEQNIQSVFRNYHFWQVKAFSAVQKWIVQSEHIFALCNFCCFRRIQCYVMLDVICLVSVIKHQQPQPSCNLLNHQIHQIHLNLTTPATQPSDDE